MNDPLMTQLKVLLNGIDPQINNDMFPVTKQMAASGLSTILNTPRQS